MSFFVDLFVLLLVYLLINLLVCPFVFLVYLLACFPKKL